jgi:hypothetical protein
VWVIALVACALAGCGHYGFCEGPGSGSAVLDAPDNQARPNVVFVTSAAVPQTFGIDLAGGDKVCADRAQAAGLPGTFVAWLSSSQVNAIDRLAGSRGWVRPDGAPVIDAPSDLVNARIFNPIDVDENQLTAAPDKPVWTGTGFDGRTAINCNDWSSTSMSVAAEFGTPGNAYPNYTAVGNALPCNSTAALYCFEVGHMMAVAPVPATSGRTVFLGHPRTSSDVSPAFLDAICQTDANNNNVSGNFLAAIAYGSTTIASRFTLDARPIHRVDGTTVAASATQLLSPSTLTSFVNQTADGSYTLTYGDFWTGATDPYSVQAGDCIDWTSFSNASGGLAGRGQYIGAQRWDVTTNSCDTGDFILCLEQ